MSLYDNLSQIEKDRLHKHLDSIKLRSETVTAAHARSYWIAKNKKDRKPEVMETETGKSIMLENIEISKFNSQRFSKK